jgi:hypothetical protein
MDKHDGSLDEYHKWVRASVEHTYTYSDIEKRVVSITGGFGDMENQGIYLDAKQALSLLAWLEQEKSKLEQFAKEDNP